MAMKKLSTGIYVGRYSIRAIVNTAIGRKEKKFAFDTPLEDIKRWRQEIIGQFAAVRRRHPVATQRGTFRADVKAYLKKVQHLASWKSRRSELEAWAVEFERKRRHQITEDMVRRVIATWRAEEVAERTIHHRVQSLRHLFHTFDGDDFPTPVDRLTFDLPKPHPVSVPASVVKKVAKALGAMRTDLADKARARLMVLATTGLRPAELMRATRDDIDLERSLWWIRTAKGGERPPLYLNAEMKVAIKAFIDAAAWGKYDTGTHAKLLYAAGWPKTIRPYYLRATFGMDVSRKGADLADVQQLLGHRHQATTRTYYVPPVGSRLAAASRSVDHRYGWAPKKKRAKKSA